MAKRRLISIPELLTGAFSLYSKVWIQLFVISVLTVAVWKIWQLVVIPWLLVVTGLTSLTAGMATGDIAAAISIGTVGLIIFLVSWFIVFMVGFLGSAGMIIALEARVKGRKKSLGEIFSQAQKYVLALIFNGIVVFLLEFLGFVLLVIPGIVLVFLLSFVNFAVVVDRKSGFSAVGRSISLVRKNFLGMVGRMIFIGLISFLINLYFGKMPLYHFISQTILLPFTITYHFLLYKDVA